MELCLVNMDRAEEEVCPVVRRVIAGHTGRQNLRWSRNSTGLKRRGLQDRLGVVALVRKLLNKDCH